MSNDLMQSALRSYQQGRFPEAELQCSRILEQQPELAQALNLLGLALLQQGAAERAIPHLERAVELTPRPTFLCNLGEACRRLNEVDRAVDALSRAIEFDSECLEAHYNLGLIERQRGELSRAVACFERAVAIEPSDPATQFQLGLALCNVGEGERGEQHLRVAIALNPNSASYRQELALLLDGRLAYLASIEEHEAVLRLEPANLVSLNNLSLAFYFLNRLEESAATLERAIEHHPSVPRLHINLGNALRGMGRIEEAARCYRRALQVDPADDKAHSNLLYLLPFVPNLTDAEISAESRGWERRHACDVQKLPLIKRRKPLARRLRIGYLSADFHEHVQALFMLPLLEHHDREAVEVICYSTSRRMDAITEEHRLHADTFRNLSGLTDDQAARVIRDDEVDVLVDLTMHMSNARLRILAAKPAPVLVSWLAYPGTTGLSTIDYRFTDPHIEPPGVSTSSVEQPWHLPETFWCYRPWFRPEERKIEPGRLPALRGGAVTFGCCNSLSKVNDAAIERWARVLRAVERSRLLILSPEGSARERVKSELAKMGVNGGRVEFLPPAAHANYLRGYQRIDISLDTLPYNGHTTSLDSWWMGVPVLSLVGETIVGRAGRCYANNLGLPDWAVDTEAAFVESALRFSSNVGALASLRASLRARIEASPLMDATRFARNVETAFREMSSRARDTATRAARPNTDAAPQVTP